MLLVKQPLIQPLLWVLLVDLLVVNLLVDLLYAWVDPRLRRNAA